MKTETKNNTTKTMEKTKKTLKIQTLKTRVKETLNIFYYDRFVWDSLVRVSTTSWEYTASLEEVENMIDTINDIIGIKGVRDFSLIMTIEENTVTI